MKNAIRGLENCIAAGAMIDQSSSHSSAVALAGSAVQDTTAPNVFPFNATSKPGLHELEHVQRQDLDKCYLTDVIVADIAAQLLPSSWQEEISAVETVFPLTIPPDFLPKERLGLDRPTAQYLRSISLASELPLDAEILNLEGPARQVRKLKQELPLLATDNEVDLLNFWRKAEPDFGRLTLKSARAYAEDYEVFDSPELYEKAKDQCHKKLKEEKLQVSRDSLLYIKTVVTDDYRTEEDVTLLELEPRKLKAPEPLTPPLLPLSPPYTPFVPASSAGHVPLLSDGVDSVAIEAKELEEALTAKDALLGPDLSYNSQHESMLFDYCRDDGAQHSSSVVQFCELDDERTRLSDLKVEGPLTPPSLSATTVQQEKCAIAQICPVSWSVPRNSAGDESGKNILSSDNTVEAFFDQIIAPLAAEVNQRVEQEQLQEADSTKRVDVPVMDFTLPQPPWKMYDHKQHGKHREGQTVLEAQQRLLMALKRSLPKSVQTWHGITELELKLRWTPFPMELGKVTIEESIDDQQALSSLLDEPGHRREVDVPLSTWKPEGLRILDSDDGSEDELDSGYFDYGTDLESLLRKRKLQLQEHEDCVGPREGMSNVGSKVGPVTSHDGTSCERRKDSNPSMSGTSLNFGSDFSATRALLDFMEIHGGKQKKQKISQPDSRLAQNARPVPDNQPSPGVPGQIVTLTDGSTLPLSTQPMPAPAMPTNGGPRSFIVNSVIWSQRHLLRQIRQTFPSAEVIERDFSAHSVSHTSTAHKPEPNLLMEEADLIISPKSGVVLTTIQKIKQKALPGQAARSAVRERLAGLASRHEQLILFVSEGRGMNSAKAEGSHASLDVNDCEALADLIAFTNTLESDVVVQYIPGGGSDLAPWIACAMVRFGLPEGKQVKLLQDETLWELFLRCAGLNAFAAQAVLAELKSPEKPDGTGSLPDASNEHLGAGSEPKPTCFGLAAFVKLLVQERLARFEALIGRRALLRVSSVIDQRWPSASNGIAL